MNSFKENDKAEEIILSLQKIFRKIHAVFLILRNLIYLILSVSLEEQRAGMVRTYTKYGRRKENKASFLKSEWIVWT